MIALIYSLSIFVVITGIATLVYICVCHFKNGDIEAIVLDIDKKESMECIAREMLIKYPKAQILLPESEEVNIIKAKNKRIITHQDS